MGSKVKKKNLSGIFLEEIRDRMVSDDRLARMGLKRRPKRGR